MTFSSESFDKCLYKILSYGGDTDTNACIVGAMAEALYVINEEYILEVQKKIPREFTEILEKGYKVIKKENKTLIK
ncbi:MAG: ADP-ribosylglycohydrolase family protein [Bacilli bacterium]|nr:ADP-ribosylglycohydrolase family protein [Bacilli bacterium]MDD4795023.1 ADP-ribosylglycohydrolase family protein [Bacilli bacterium]